MARTWSVPQRRTFAGAALLGKCGATAASVGRTLAREPHRSFILILAAFATLLGIAVLNFDSQSIATIMFLAGAGLAGLVLLPSTSVSAHQPHAVQASDVRFAELMQRPLSASTQLDRAQWAKLTAHMSHELRTPLNAVLGFSELMTKEVFGPLGSNCYGDYARDIHASGRMLLKSAEDALAITAVLTSPERLAARRTCHLNTVVEEACAAAHYELAAHSITLDCVIESGIEVCGDAQALRQALVNVLAESIRNAAPGACISIHAEDLGNGVLLTLSLQDREAMAPPLQDGFALILAGTLCDLCGARLTYEMAEGRDRIWQIDFLAAAQNDLFRNISK